jgi:2-hydroxychromene-2-carboxylate isomerase
MPPIIWYFDPISPFAYLALPSVERLARSHAILYRPIVFGAVLAHCGQLGPAEIPAKRLHTYRLCQFLADTAGIPFRFPPAHPFRSLDTLRLLAALDAGPAATRIVMDFIWRDGRDAIAEREGLVASVTAVPFDALIAQTGAKTSLRSWTDEAIAARVFGVPTLRIGNELFWGVDAIRMAEAYINDPDLLVTAQMSRLASLPIGVQRSPGNRAQT